MLSHGFDRLKARDPGWVSMSLPTTRSPSSSLSCRRWISASYSAQLPQSSLARMSAPRGALRTLSTVSSSTYSTEAVLSSARMRQSLLDDLGEIAFALVRALERLLELVPAEREQLDVADRADRRVRRVSASSPTSPKNWPGPSVASSICSPSEVRRVTATS